jgi:2-iminobutanoate/2-iminopropanoate deaminase
MPIATSVAATVSAIVAAVADSGSPMTSSVPTASVTFAPWRMAPSNPKIPTRKPARSIEMAFAPTAGANGVDPDDPAPIAHAINRLASPATTSVASAVGATIYRVLTGVPSRACRLRRTICSGEYGQKSSLEWGEVRVRMREVETDDAPPSIGPFSQGIIDDGTLYVSGQGPVDPDTEAIIDSDDVRDQTRQTLENIEAVLDAADCSLDDVVKTTVFVRDMDDYDDINDVYGELMSAPYPARSAVEVQDLPIDIDVEIEAIASL